MRTRRLSRSLSGPTRWPSSSTDGRPVRPAVDLPRRDWPPRTGAARARGRRRRALARGFSPLRPPSSRLVQNGLSSLLTLACPPPSGPSTPSAPRSRGPPPGPAVLPSPARGGMQGTTASGGKRSSAVVPSADLGSPSSSSSLSSPAPSGASRPWRRLPSRSPRSRLSRAVSLSLPCVSPVPPVPFARRGSAGWWCIERASEQPCSRPLSLRPSLVSPHASSTAYRSRSPTPRRPLSASTSTLGPVTTTRLESRTLLSTS